MRKRFFAWLIALLWLGGMALAEDDVTSKAMLNAPGRRIGVSQGSAAEAVVQSEMPEATIEYYTDYLLGYTAVAQGKLDAFVADSVQMQLTVDGGLAGVHLLSEFMDETVKIAVGYSAVSGIPDLGDRLNRFIAEVKEDGTLDDMYRRWVLEGNAAMPEISVPEKPKLHLTVGTTGNVPPYSYYEGDGLTGYDIELAHRFAAWLGADVSFQVFDFDGVVPALKAGKVDVVMSNLQYLPERAEGTPFSDILYEEKFGILVRGDAPSVGDAPAANETPASDAAAPAYVAYNGRRLGVLTGPLMEDVAREYFPDSEYLLFNSYPDCITALLAGKIDAYLGDELGVKTAHMEQPEIDYIRERITENNYSFAFRKDDPESAALCEELNDFLARCWADGTMDELNDIWFGEDEARKVVDMSGLTGQNGTIRVVTTSTDPPFSYIKDGKNVGYDIDLVVRFCRDRGYALELGDVDFAGRIPAIESGKYDFTTDMNVTPEREEEVLFSDPVCKGGIVLAVLSGDLGDVGIVGAGALTSLSQLDGKRIGVATGTTFDAIVRKALPDAEIVYINSSADLIAALEAGKIDGFAVDEPAARQFCAEKANLAVLDEYLETFEFGFVLPKTDRGEELSAELDAWLSSMKESGALEQVIEKWANGPEDAKTVPDYAAFPAPKGRLILVTEGDYVPMNYYRGNEIVGAEIDLIAQFCETNGYGLEVKVMNFDGILPAVQAGKADLAAAGITITEERAESVIFSAPYYTDGTVMMVLKGEEASAAGTGAQPELTSFSDLSGKTVSMLTGAPFEELVRSKVPDVGKFTSFSNMPDMLLALRSGKTDAVLNNNAIATLALNRNPDLALFPQEFQSGAFGFAFAKGDPRRDEWQATFDAIPQTRIQAAWYKWTGADDSVKTLPEQDWPGLNGTVRVAACDTLEPMSYVGGDGSLKGFDLEVILMIAKELDMRVEFSGMEFAAILSSVQSGKADIGAGSIIITEERAQAVDFLEYHPAAFVLIVRAVKTPKAQTPDNASFWDGIASSFHKTFIREGRWRLFVDGILTTLLITLLTILFGTLLGFWLFMLCRNGNPAANLVTRFCLWLVQGMPMVVLLMILYYIIFGSVAISGVAVAVIGFTLTFGAAVYGLLKMGVGAVDGGQYEAAYALGYSNRRTFFRIILPQALPHVLPAYRGEIVGLIKATAIVGYIAVQDLTKMGDIVRSRTYEAFFPLIAITVIYFVLEGLIGFLVSRIGVNFNPKRRKPADILKGVNIDDQN